MKKIKIIMFAVTLILFGFILCSCGSNAYASDNTKDTFKYIDSFDTVDIFQYVDQETGVNYIIVGTWNTGSSKYAGIGITPRLNNDGSLYITK